MKTSILLLLLGCGYLSAIAQRYPNDSIVEVRLLTSGNVTFAGANSVTAVKGALSNRQNKADSLIKRRNETANNKVTVFTKKEDEGKSHGNVTLPVPPNYKLNFLTSTGDVTLIDVNANVIGRAEKGNLSVVRSSGRMELKTDTHNITVTDSEASGFVMTKTGTVTLQDVGRDLVGISQEGKVIYKTTTNYFKTRRYASFDLSFEKAEVEVANAPEGGTFTAVKGNIVVKNAGKNVHLKTTEGSLSVAPASMGVRAQNRLGGVVVQMAVNSTSLEPVVIEAQEGNVDLYVPLNFAGDFVITLVQNKNFNILNRVNSFLDLGSIKAEEVVDTESKRLMSRHTQISRVIRNGKRPVRIRVVNGNVNIIRI
ncbi:hypothetical protein [Runella zeae]|uniref:hypothetical protein n=1 Tax=Runella zeae TaxID=94255 RepID=UPI00042639F9|nr:hypothetical protein [Runella zeae]